MARMRLRVKAPIEVWIRPDQIHVTFDEQFVVWGTASSTGDWRGSFDHVRIADRSFVSLLGTHRPSGNELQLANAEFLGY